MWLVRDTVAVALPAGSNAHQLQELLPSVEPNVLIEPAKLDLGQIWPKNWSRGPSDSQIRATPRSDYAPWGLR